MREFFSKHPQGVLYARLGLAAALIVASLLIPNVQVIIIESPYSSILPPPQTITAASVSILILRLLAALCAGYDLVYDAVQDIMNRLFPIDALPITLAVVLAFCNGMSLEAAIAMTLFRAALPLRDWLCARTGETLVGEIYADDATALNMRRGYRLETRTGRELRRISNYVYLGLLALAALMLIILPTVGKLPFAEGLRRVITIIAVASPLGALVCLPAVFLARMAAESRRGVLFLSSKALDDAALSKTVVFDKAGTLLSDELQLADVESGAMDADTFLKIAAYAVSRSFDPYALAIMDAYGARVDDELISDFAEKPGWGVSVRVDTMRILLGTQDFFAMGNLRLEGAVPGDNSLYMVIEGQLAGRIALTRPMASDASGTLDRLRREGAERLVMISGDSRRTDSQVAQALGIDEYYSECTRNDAVRSIDQLRAKLGSQNVIALVRGAEDTGAADSADVVFEVGAYGARERGRSADVLIPSESIEQLPDALKAARLARTFAQSFVYAAFGVKLLLAVLALTGLCPLWFGVTIDCAASLTLIFGVLWTGK